MIDVYAVPTRISRPESGYRVVEMDLDLAGIDFASLAMSSAESIYRQEAERIGGLRMANSVVYDASPAELREAAVYRRRATAADSVMNDLLKVERSFVDSPIDGQYVILYGPQTHEVYCSLMIGIGGLKTISRSRMLRREIRNHTISPVTYDKRTSAKLPAGAVLLGYSRKNLPDRS